MKCSHCRRMKQKCERSSETLPCKRCQQKGKVCESYYLPRDDPKLQQPRLVISDPSEIEIVEKFRRQKKTSEAEATATETVAAMDDGLPRSESDGVGVGIGEFVLARTAGLGEMWTAASDFQWEYSNWAMWADGVGGDYQGGQY